MKRVCAEDIYKITLLDDAQISPDGKKLAYIKTKVLPEEPYYQNSLILRSLETGMEEVICACKAAYPLWRSDSGEIAFLAEDKDSRQIFQYTLAAARTEQVTHMRYGVWAFTYTPDEKGFYFLSEMYEGQPEEELVREKTEDERKAEEWDKANRAVKISGMLYRDAVGGFQTGRKGQLWRVCDGKQEKLSEDFLDLQALSLSPDGKYLAVISEPTERAEYRAEQNTLWGYETETGKWQKWVDGVYVMQWPVWGADGSRAYFMGHEYQYGWNSLYKLYAYSIEDKICRCVTEKLDEEFVDSGINDLRGGTACRGPIYSRKNGCFYLPKGCDGNSVIVSLNPDTLEEKEIVYGEKQIFGFSYCEETDCLAYVYTSPLVPNDIVIHHLADQSEEEVTHSNAEYLEQTELAVPERIQAVSFDGLEIHGWIMKPCGFREEEKYPAILEIHGGPSLMYSNSYMHEFQLLAAEGNVVFCCNPRGGSGRGQKFEAGITRENSGRGADDFKDLMAVTDYAASLPWVDENRMGVTGGSYGGLLTNWVVTHTGRFKAALTQRSITNILSFRGTSDLGFCDPVNSYQSDYFDEEFLKAMSPLTYVSDVTTPLCILHSVNDYRCPLSQAEEFYTALTELGKKVEMYIFPNSNHGLSRSGRPPIRIQRLEIICDWFKRML